MIVLPARRRQRHERSPVEALSQRQREVLDAYIIHGEQKDIAAALCISLQTVKNHVSHILDKLDCASSLQAVILYDRWRREQAWPEVERRSGQDRRWHERRKARRAA